MAGRISAGDLKRAAGAAERIAQLLETKASLPTSRSPQHISLGAAAACEFHGVNFPFRQRLTGSPSWILILVY